MAKLLQEAGGSLSAGQTSQADLESGRVNQQARPFFFDSITVTEAVELYSAIRAIRPTASGEVGFCCAGSGLAILKALADNGHGKHYACDPFQTSYAKNAGLNNVVSAGLNDRLEFHEAFPEEAVPKFPRCQFAFIDASHLFDLSILDFVLIDKRLDVGGIVAFHDLWLPALQKIIRFILKNRDYELYRPPGVNGDASKRTTLRGLIARTLGWLPRADAIFTQEVLTPWLGFGVTNLVMLRKIKEDDRDWRYFKRF